MTSKAEWVSIQTTLPTRPLPLNSSRPAFTTERLVIRALGVEDVQALHVLRTQPEVMANTPQGRIDKDVGETRSKLAHYLPPNDEKTYEFAICLKETDEVIGLGGCHSLSSMFGWPEIGYMLRREFWGQGLATEFLRTWLDMWYALPRTEEQVDVHPKSTFSEHGGDTLLVESVIAFTTADNVASQKVLQKSGFQHFLTWIEPDLRNPDVDIALQGYKYFPNSHKVVGKEKVVPVKAT
ncbi:acyl-CoA N-acyltransferase [Coniochaeta sp. PMI_546]|nr:acyl-CoA N-acyltransferase [Coniochaeta sp. PMI_546]